jgi:hypothetical protein
MRAQVSKEPVGIKTVFITPHYHIGLERLSY